MENKEKNVEVGITDKDKVIMIIGGIFFLILAIFAFFGGNGEVNLDDFNTPVTSGDVVTSDNENNEEEKELTGLDKYFENIRKNNYKFTYTHTSNNGVEILDGMVYNNKAKFSIFSNGYQEYGKISDNYLKLENGTYNVVSEVRDYFKYLNIEDIIDIIDISMFDESDNEHSYEISVIDLFDMYSDFEYDTFEDYNDDSIVLEVSNDSIKTITLDYSNYFTYINGYKTVFKVKMEFFNYGQVEDFEL